MKKVSVIIPTYKRSDSLLRAINSILNQTYKNIEIIVVDDNDEDSVYRKENEKKLSKFIYENKIIYIKHKKNKNGAVARNSGIKVATGDYITFLDDDDYFYEKRIEKLVKLLNENKDYQGAYSSIAFFRNSKLFKIKNASLSGNLKENILMMNCFFGSGSNIFLTKEIVNKIGLFDEKFKRNQDLEYLVRFFRYGKIINLDEVLLAKCVDDTSNSLSFDNYYKTKEMFLNKYKKDINEFDEEIKNKIYFKNYKELMYFYPNKYKDVKKIVSKYGKITIKDKIIIFLRFINLKLPFFTKLFDYIRSIKLKKYKNIYYID